MRLETERAGRCATSAGSASDQENACSPDLSRVNRTAPVPRQAHGLLHHLEVAQARVDQAGDYQTRRQARRAANRLRRALRPAPVQAPDWRHVEAERLMQVRALARWATEQSGGGR